MKILVFAQYDWSFNNLKPALKGLNYTRFVQKKDKKTYSPQLDIKKYDLVITCEPHNPFYTILYGMVKNKLPILAMQQGIYWNDKVNPHATWKFNRYLLWGKMTKECCDRYPKLKGKTIITGLPAYDGYRGIQTKDEGYTLILEDRFNRKVLQNSIRKESGRIVKQEHPANIKHKKGKTQELIRCASKVIFSATSAGFYAMLMHKPVRIIKPSQIIPGNKYLHYKFCKAFGSEKYISNNDEYLKYAITGNMRKESASDQVRKIISEYGNFEINE